jgi:hypothetical protein
LESGSGFLAGRVTSKLPWPFLLQKGSGESLSEAQQFGAHRFLRAIHMPQNCISLKTKELGLLMPFNIIAT